MICPLLWYFWYFIVHWWLDFSNEGIFGFQNTLYMSSHPILFYFLTAFFLGSIPTGHLAALIQGRESIFHPGGKTTKNAGEIFQILGLKTALFVTVFDFLKGVLTVSLLIKFFFGQIELIEVNEWWIVSLGALLVVIGHCNSPWIGLKGGKGLATTFGVLVYLLPIPTILAGIIWGGLSFWGLSIRPGALISAVALPIFSIPWVLLYAKDHLFYLYIVAFFSLLIFWEYRTSLRGYLGISTPGPQEKQEPPPAS